MGVIFYELLFGVTPWVADILDDLRQKMMLEPVNFKFQNNIYILGCISKQNDYLRGVKFHKTMLSLR